MEVSQAIKKRFSCRDYIDKTIEKPVLDKILEAARQAPSARNTQDWRFVIARDKQIRSKVAATANRPDIFEKASVIIAACSNSKDIMTCGQHIAPIDISIALEHIALQATELGLATCWIGSFNEPEVKKILQIPPSTSVIELMALGYPASGSRQTDRLPTEQIFCYDKWDF